MTGQNTKIIDAVFLTFPSIYFRIHRSDNLKFDFFENFC